jgi:hypothetical protein
MFQYQMRLLHLERHILATLARTFNSFTGCHEGKDDLGIILEC